MKQSNRTASTGSVNLKKAMVRKAENDEIITKMKIESEDVEDESDSEEEDDDDLEGADHPAKSDNMNGTTKRSKKNMIDTLKAKKHRDASVIYIGHLPALFGEFELLSLLKQFGGTITHIRISRSEKTGNSRGYAFIRILESDIASIIVNTLSGYLLFSQKSIGTHKRFVCHVVPPEKVHPRLFIKHTCAIAISKARKQQKLLQSKQSKSLSKLSAVNEKLLKEEQKKRLKIKEAGIDYDFPGYEKKDPTSSTTAATSVSNDSSSDKMETSKSNASSPSAAKSKATDLGVAKQNVVQKVIHSSNVEKDTLTKSKQKGDLQSFIPTVYSTKKRLHDDIPVAPSSASKASLPMSSISKSNNQGKKKKNRHSH
jgi:nucleolar protein 15